MQWVPVPKTCLMTSIYLELRPNSLRRPFRAFRDLDLEPRACALGCPAGPPLGSLVSSQKLTKLNKLTPGTTSLPRSIGRGSGVDGKDRFLLGGGGALSDDGAELIL